MCRTLKDENKLSSINKAKVVQIPYTFGLLAVKISFRIDTKIPLELWIGGDATADIMFKIEDMFLDLNIFDLSTLDPSEAQKQARRSPSPKLASRDLSPKCHSASTATSAMGSDSRVAAVDAAAGEMNDVGPAVSLMASIAGTNPSAGAMDADGAGAARGPVPNLLDRDPGEGAQRRAGAAVTRDTRPDDAGPSDRERGVDTMGHLAHLATTGGVKVDIAILPCALHL